MIDETYEIEKASVGLYNVYSVVNGRRKAKLADFHSIWQAEKFVVRKKLSHSEIITHHQDDGPSSREIGTASLANLYRSQTPGQ